MLFFQLPKSVGKGFSGSKHVVVNSVSLISQNPIMLCACIVRSIPKNQNGKFRLVVVGGKHIVLFLFVRSTVQKSSQSSGCQKKNADVVGS